MLLQDGLWLAVHRRNKVSTLQHIPVSDAPTVTVYFCNWFVLYDFNTWNTFGCLALKIYCSPEGTRLPIRICFHSWFLNTNCTCLKLIFMCWFVMLITLTLTSLFEKLQLFLPDGFLPCDLCKTCSDVPRLRLKGDVDWFNV